MATESNSFLDMETTKECIYKIRDLNRKFRLSCSQLLLLNNLIDETEVHYNRSKAENRHSYRYILRMKLHTLERVRNLFYEYAYEVADKLETMQLELYRRTGIKWNETLAVESEGEDCDSEEEYIEVDSDIDLW